MLTKRVIPCLLLLDRGLVKTIQFKNPTYIGDPINAVKIFNEKEVDELIFLDITASKEKRKPDLKLIREIANEAFMPFCYGGGVDNIDTIKDLFHLGVEKVSLNSHAVLQPNLVKSAADIFGSQSVVVTIDVRKNLFGKKTVHILSGKKNTGLNPVAFAKQMQEEGAGELLINSVDCDGVMKGYDIELLKEITNSVNIPVIACGGAGVLDDFKKATTEGGASAASAGSMFVYYGRQKGILINYPERKKLETLLQ